MITLFSVFSTTFAVAVVLCHDASLTTELPSSIYLLGAVCIFIYQTLDALDGKQARRLKAGTPLGQLFDHGCDSFSATGFVVLLLINLRVESLALNLLVYTGTISTIYMSNFCEYYTGVMHTALNGFGVTEVQFTQIGLLLFSGLGFGWVFQTPIGSLRSLSRRLEALGTARRCYRVPVDLWLSDILP